jgi:hypothetical protein
MESNFPPLPMDDYDWIDDKGKCLFFPATLHAHHACTAPSSGHVQWAHLPPALCHLVLEALEDRDVVSAALACRAWGASCSSSHCPFGKARRLFVDGVAAIRGTSPSTSVLFSPCRL